jgi:hypothetical protein
MKHYFLLPFLVFAGCSNPKKAQRSHASFSMELPAPEQGEIWNNESENQAQEILDLTLAMLVKSSSSEKFVKRDAHPKAHGCVKAKIDFDITNLSLDNRVGIFAKNKSYEAWIRFSNGTKNIDLEKDVRGMAIKVMNVENTPTGVHDFLLATNVDFFTQDGSDYLDLFKSLSSESKLDLAKYAIKHPFSAKRLLEARTQTGNLLKENYHSSVPYKLGKRSARYRAVSCAKDRDAIPLVSASADYLRERLVKDLATSEYCFDFFVQPNLNPRVQNIEDPRISWDDKNSKPIKVARITIPKQIEIELSKRIIFCENMQFNPWRSHAENRPMGQVNRIRALVYEEISRFRHGKNRTPIMEPVNHMPCSYKTSALCDEPK